MTFRKLKWAAILASSVFVGIFELAHFLLWPAGGGWPARLFLGAVVALGAAGFYAAVFAGVERTRKSLIRRNEELVALRKAGLDIAGELALEAVLQKVVDLACELLTTRYGALAVMDEQDRIEAFVTSGISHEERQRIGAPPEGQGLLGIVLREGQHLRVGDIARDSRRHGFPAHHPAMRSLLAVPILCRAPFRGNLYVSEKLDASPFEEEDEATLVRFAAQAAIAIDNAHLHRQAQDLATTQERLRISREMHDGVAQVLAYCNTKLQAIREFLTAERQQEAVDHLEQLAGTAREVYADVREGILGLRTSLGPDCTFRDAIANYIERWGEQSGIHSELSVDEDLNLEPWVELQLLRIIQEALSNVRKHSKAEHSRVRLSCADERLVVSVEDDGVGFNPTSQRRSPSPRFGLSTMRERAEAIGGRLDIDSAPGEGTRVRVEVSKAPSRLDTGGTPVVL